MKEEPEYSFPDSYDKSVAGVNLVNAVIYCDAVHGFQWGNYHCLTGPRPQPDLMKKLAELALEEQKHRVLIDCFYDRNESLLERVVAAEGAQIAALAGFVLAETSPRVRMVFEHLIGDHLTHRNELLKKLAAKAGLTPLAAANFPAVPGRDWLDQYQEIGEAYLEHVDTVALEVGAQTRIRAALALEIHLCRLYNQQISSSEDRHLIFICRQALMTENIHISLVQSLIEPEASILDRVFFGEAAEIAVVEGAREVFRAAKFGPLLDVVCEEDQAHLRRLARLFPGENGPIKIEELPVFAPAAGIDDVVARIAAQRAA